MTPWGARLLVLNVVMFALTLVVPGLGDALMFVPALILSRPWSIVTYMFLHAGFGHIFFNMLALYFFGPRLEARIGSRRFLGLYLVSGVVGGLLSFTSPMTGVIGASGAVYGVMFGYAHYWPRDLVHIWGVLPVEVRWMVVGLTAISLVSGFGAAGDGIAHFAHLGGFLGAWIYLRVLDQTTGARRFRAQAVAAARPTLEPPSAAVARWSKIDRADLHPVNLEELDRVLAKIQQEGVGRLTEGEREFLERFSQRGA
jgi:membrane associated rhomboid family serine protease